MLPKVAFIKSSFNKLFDLDPYHKKHGCSNETKILLGVQL